MPNIQIDAVAGLTVRDITHVQLTALPATATVADVRAWFAASTSRRLAFVVDDDGRYLGALAAADVADGAPDGPAIDAARPWTTVAPDEPAARGLEHALASPTLRAPVVDGDGRLLGVVAVNKTHEWFCGTDATPPPA